MSLTKCNRFSYTVTRDGTKCWMNNNKKGEKKKLSMKNDKRLYVGCLFFAMVKNWCILWLLLWLYIFDFGLNICICTTIDAAIPFSLSKTKHKTSIPKRIHIFFFYFKFNNIVIIVVLSSQKSALNKRKHSTSFPFGCLAVVVVLMMMVVVVVYLSCIDK